MFTIYVLENIKTNKYYVGQTTQSLKKRFCKGNNYRKCAKMNEAITTYGWDSFKLKETIITDSQDKADQVERYFIGKYNSIINGYNISYGGKKHFKLNKETKKKLSNSLKGNHNGLATEFKKGSVNKRKDTKMKLISRIKLSIANKGKHNSPETEFTHERTSLGNNPRARAVKQYDKNYNLIKEYSCCAEASLETGIPASSIRSCRNGNQKQAGGYYWIS